MNNRRLSLCELIAIRVLRLRLGLTRARLSRFTDVPAANRIVRQIEAVDAALETLTAAQEQKLMRHVITLLIIVCAVLLAVAAMRGSQTGGTERDADSPSRPAHSAPAPDDTLPTDPCLRCAVKALRGDFGPLEEWQRVGYEQALRHGVVWAEAWVTQYYPQEGHHRGDETRWGYPVDERCAAANELPGFSFVWSNRFGLRQVLDTGADRNDRVARSRWGAEHWVDIWVPRPGTYGFICEVMPVAAIRGRQPAQWKHGRSTRTLHGLPPANAWLAY